MRKTISSKLNFLKYLHLLLILYFGYLITDEIIRCFNETVKSLVPIFFLIILEILWFLVLFFIIRLRVVEFDDENLYVTYKKVEQKIPLVKIYSLKFTMIELNGYHFWKIKYRDSENNNYSVRILPNRNFTEFKEIIKERFKNVTVKNWSHSFDFDQ